MILEVGLFAIDPPRAGESAPVASDIRAAFARDVEGPHFFELQRAIEGPGRWTVIAGLDAPDDHKRFVASHEGVRQRHLLAKLGRPDALHLLIDRIGASLS
jgi:hypothetical protein